MTYDLRLTFIDTSKDFNYVKIKVKRLGRTYINITTSNVANMLKIINKFVLSERRIVNEYMPPTYKEARSYFWKISECDFEMVKHFKEHQKNYSMIRELLGKAREEVMWELKLHSISDELDYLEDFISELKKYMVDTLILQMELVFALNVHFI